jgi:hypothetical protein
MVCATLDGRKTNTRRMNGLDVINKNPDDYHHPYQEKPGVWYFHKNSYPSVGPFKCPYGIPGDRLWVRETWALSSDCGLNTPDAYGTPVHRASFPYTIGERHDAGLLREPARWKPPIYMPRWASRILLEITDIGVERVQDISEEDAIAEGMQFHNGGEIHHSGYRHDINHGFVYSTAREAMSVLWDSIHGPGSWDKNPWVWVVKFKVIKSK